MKKFSLLLLLGALLGQVWFLEYRGWREVKKHMEFDQWINSHPLKNIQTHAELKVTRWIK